MKLRLRDDLGVRILIGADAVREFGKPRDPDRMRRATEAAFKRVRDLFAEQGLMVANLMRENGDETG